MSRGGPPHVLGIQGDRLPATGQRLVWGLVILNGAAGLALQVKLMLI